LLAAREIAPIDFYMAASLSVPLRDTCCEGLPFPFFLSFSPPKRQHIFCHVPREKLHAAAVFSREGREREREKRKERIFPLGENQERSVRLIRSILAETNPAIII
jgi:hypothetical protein